MSTQPNHVYIERIDAPRNMARYYVLDMTSTLFGDVCLTRAWGRIGCRGQSKTCQTACKSYQVPGGNSV
ncbi:WGR domain-containing protein [Agrobacterium rosae]|uniref:WGR domain-containing protein n=1 Tax=Agrobacterium rosae TaxID=1972867 RepID=A0AAW9FT95_9HYPH|nr:WGR domain-containing protein [Agrobacterium rosae]MDX8305988.1 WGR domain-containing protein [Agrobacterium rosae]